MSPKREKDSQLRMLAEELSEARARQAKYNSYPPGHPQRVSEDRRAQQAGYRNAASRWTNEVNELAAKLEHADGTQNTARWARGHEPGPAQTSEAKQWVLTEYESDLANGIGSSKFTDVRPGSQIIPGASLELGPATPAVDLSTMAAPQKPATPTAPTREASRQAATRSTEPPPPAPVKAPVKGSTTVLSRARQEAAAREIRAEDTVTEAEHAVSEEMAQMRRHENDWVHAEGKEREAARARVIAQERPLMEALRALVVAREDYQQASQAHRELIRHEEARAVLRARHRERLGRLRWWQKPGQRAAEHPVKALAWFTGLLGALVTAFATGAVSLFYDWVGGLLGIGG